MHRLVLYAVILAFTVRNQHGDVRFASGEGGMQRAVPAGRTAVLREGDIVRTGDDSMATIDLPDGSRIVQGSKTVLRAGEMSFAATDRARFAFSAGHIRFDVMHPEGRVADYRFATPIATIVVRGTLGDIEVDSRGMRLTVFGASRPVMVLAGDGTTYAVTQGEKMWMQREAGRLSARIMLFTRENHP